MGWALLILIIGLFAGYVFSVLTPFVQLDQQMEAIDRARMMSHG